MPIQEILFANGHRAQLMTLPTGTPAANAILALKIKPPQAVILLVGGADDLDEGLKPRLLQLLSGGLAKVAAGVGALILDGGTKSGVMALMGEAVAEGRYQAVLLGMAPAGKVTYPGDDLAPGESMGRTPLDPNHSHFVLVESNDWGGETEAMFEIAESLAGSQTPIVAVLADGGPHSLPEVLRCVRQGWPLVILSGTGRLADELARGLTDPATVTGDPAKAEILTHSDLIALFPIQEPVEKFQELLERKLSLDPTLNLAWKRQATYSSYATKNQVFFRRTQKWLLALGVLATILALVKDKVPKHISIPYSDLAADMPRIIHVLLIIIPITTAAMLAMMNRFKWGQQWVFLRNASEAVKREFYRYWTGTGTYRRGEAKDASRQVKLALKLEEINGQLLQTEVNLTAMSPTAKLFPFQFAGLPSGPDGYYFLSPDYYLTLRLDKQLNYYRTSAVSLEKNLKWLNRFIYIFGGLGTYLAAVGQEIWVAATTAMVTAFTAYLGLTQVEKNLKAYNQAAAALEDVKLKWSALSSTEKKDPLQFDKLVEETETILLGEHSAWVKQMQEAMADRERKLQAAQEKEKEEKEKKKNQVQPNKPPKGEETPAAEQPAG
jgi:hypothetical protein